MKIQEISQDVTEGEILFLSSRTLYIKANTQKDEETDNLSTISTHMCPTHSIARLGTWPSNWRMNIGA